MRLEKTQDREQQQKNKNSKPTKPNRTKTKIKTMKKITRIKADTLQGIDKSKLSKVTRRAIKKYKDQMDESSAGAKVYDDEEQQMLMTSKLQQRIEFQNTLRKSHLAMKYKFVETGELIQIYNKYDTQYELHSGKVISGKFDFKRDKSGNVLYGFISVSGSDGKPYKEYKAEEVKRNIPGITDTQKPEWFGLPMPKPVLYNEIQIQLHDFHDLKGKVMYMSKELVKLGFSKQEIKNVREQGRFITDLKLLEKMEKEYQDKMVEQDKQTKGVIDGRK